MIARLSVSLLCAALGSASCTWLVLSDLDAAPAPCTAAADCFAGQACAGGTCTTVEPGAPPPAPSPATVGAGGGTVSGPDGVRLVIPAGALDDDVAVVVERASPSLVPRGFVEAARFYRVRPAVLFSPSAALEIPVDDDVCDEAACAVFARNDDGSWRRLASAAGAAAGAVRGLVSGDGTFGAGAPLVDAGVPDAGFTADGGPDGGAPDGGGDIGDAGPPSFAACDLSPDDCANDEVCAPHPFLAATGICLRACSAGCACCGELRDVEGEYCLPGELCGAGLLGDACPNGTADCAPLSSSACVDLGGGPRCASPCVGGDECGAGCCVKESGGDGLFCAPSAACGAAPLGEPCVDDDACASGRCASHDPGAAPRRCTEACTPGSCGAGSCCFPTSCAGEWLCAPESACAAIDLLVCDGVCLSDGACAGGGSCVDGACTP